MKKSQKMENLRYVIVSYLYIEIWFIFRCLRYHNNLSAKKCKAKFTQWKVNIFGIKVGILMKNRKKNGKSKIHNSFFLIHCNIIIKKLKA